MMSGIQRASSEHPNCETQLPANSPTAVFDPTAYWEERLLKNPGITGVGYTALGRCYNHWLYKIRRRVFLRLGRTLKSDWRATRVLDIGSGTGFYFQLWKEMGVGFLEGSDLTEIALSRLREKFPGDTFQQLDIGGKVSQPEIECFDVVSALDVFFHIVDDSRYARAFKNVHNILRPGGYFIFSDLFLHGTTQRGVHVVSRSLREVEELLQTTGFAIVRRVPMFVLMNQPLDTDSQVHAFLWRAFVYTVRQSEVLGYAFGAGLYPLELLLTRILNESPTTEILVCRKTSAMSNLE